MNFKFVHAADLHLDTPCQALSKSPELQKAIHDATFRAFENVVDLCLKEQVSFLALAGDLFDARDRSIPARLRLHDGLTRLHQAGILTFIVHGNHDPLSGETGSLHPLASVKVFGSEWEEHLVKSPQGHILCRVQGVSYPQERVTENLSARFARQGPEFTLALLHANVANSSKHANYAPCSLEDLASKGLDYWALGHVHTRTEYLLASGLAVYPGNTQGRHVNEQGERGCMLVRVTEGRAEPRFVPTQVLKWEQIEVDLTSIDNWDAVISKIEKDVFPASAADHQPRAIRVRLVGRTPLSRELDSIVDRAEWEERLRATWLKRSPPAYLECMQNDTRADLDFEALQRSGGVVSSILNASETSQADEIKRRSLWEAAELHKLDIQLSRLGVAPLWPQADLLIQRAASRVVDSLVAPDNR